ncbi:hypothetical protein [Endozoicomonas acroporae]|uniref:hypothetical protein n=1 Tax=Endozoicomonas acroporae TaxID=1701104 RepID=UPI003D7BFE45
MNKEAFITPLLGAVGRGLVKSNPKVRRLAGRARQAYRRLPEQHRKDLASVGSEVGKAVDDYAVEKVREKLKAANRRR